MKKAIEKHFSEYLLKFLDCLLQGGLLLVELLHLLGGVYQPLEHEVGAHLECGKYSTAKENI